MIDVEDSRSTKQSTADVSSQQDGTHDAEANQCEATAPAQHYTCATNAGLSLQGDTDADKDGPSTSSTASDGKKRRKH